MYPLGVGGLALHNWVFDTRTFRAIYGEKGDARYESWRGWWGDNPPYHAKAEGDGPMQSYIAAIPGWKRDIGKRLERSSRATCRTCAKL
jgi:hypothetical protein